MPLGPTTFCEDSRSRVSPHPLQLTLIIEASPLLVSPLIRILDSDSASIVAFSHVRTCWLKLFMNSANFSKLIILEPSGALAVASLSGWVGWKTMLLLLCFVPTCLGCVSHRGDADAYDLLYSSGFPCAIISRNHYFSRPIILVTLQLY